MDALSDHGVNVHIAIYFVQRFSILRAVSRLRECNLIHLHWTDLFLVAGNPCRSIIKYCLFLFELLVLRITGVKVVWTVHNIVSHECQYRKIELFFNKLLLRFCDHVIVHCKAAWREVVQTYKSSLNGKATIIPHGHYTNCYENQISQLHARNLLKIGQKDTVFLHFGAIRSYKGIPDLIEAFKKLKCRQSTLLIVGMPLTNDIKTQIEKECQEDNRIRAVLEFVPSDHVQVYMNAADIVVMPFKDILASGSVLLTMSFAKAIVAPRLGCLPEILNAKGAILYDPIVGDGLYRALEKACQTDIESMGRYNFNRANQFDWNKIGNMTHEVYKKCLENRRPRSEDNKDGQPHAV